MRRRNPQELLMPVAFVKVPDDFALQQIQRGEQRGRSVPFVVVGHGSAAALLQRQAGLGAVQRLDLALFVDTSTIALSGGFRYRPTTSVAFPETSDRVTA